MNFITVTDQNTNATILINLDQVICMNEWNKGTRIVTVDESGAYVKETLQEISSLVAIRQGSLSRLRNG